MLGSPDGPADPSTTGRGDSSASPGPGCSRWVVALTAAAGDLVQSWWWLAALAIVALAAIGAHRVLPTLWILAPAEAAAAALVIGLGMRDAY